MKKLKLNQLVIFVLLLIIHIILFYSVFTPDYLGPIIRRMPGMRLVYYILPIVSALYFTIKYSSETCVSRYFGKAIFSLLIIVATSFIALLPLSNKMDTIRCQQTGFCIGGEPYDYMSTIFLIVAAVTTTFIATASTIIFGVIIRFFKLRTN